MDYKQYNDYELIYMVKENDEVSRDLLVKKYQPVINSIVNYYYSKYKNMGYQFEDFYQEAILAFYKTLSSYDPNKDVLFYTYVVLCVRRTLLSYVRGIRNDKSRRVLERYVELDDISYYVEDPKTNLETIYDEIETERLIKEFMYEIPLKLGVILELKFNGFNYLEIGTLLDIPSSTVEYRMRRIRKLLRNKLSKVCCK